MKFFTKKTFWFKLIVSLGLLFIVLNFGMSNVSNAEENWKYNTAKSAAMTGGELIAPIVDLMLGLGDAIISVIQQAIMGTESAITINTASKLIFAIAAAIGMVLVIGLAVAALGTLLPGLMALKFVAGAIGIAKIAAGAAVFNAAYHAVDGKFFPDVTLIPTYSISAEEIFKGDILLFDVNIFNPKEVMVEVYLPAEEQTADDKTQENKDLAHSATGTTNGFPATAAIFWGNADGTASTEQGIIYVNNARLKDGQTFEYVENGQKKTYTKNGNSTIKLENVDQFTWDGVTYYKGKGASGTGGGFSTEKAGASQNTGKSWLAGTDLQSGTPDSSNASGDSSIPLVSARDTQDMTAEEWKKATIPQTDSNGNVTNQSIIDTYKDYKVSYYYYVDSNGDRVVTSANNSALDLKNTVAKWYYTLRNLAVVALMIVLVYIGIRLLTTSVASDKAKYKQMLLDWLVAICLIFVMQYIMVFANNFTEDITELLSNIADKNLHYVPVKNPNEKLVEGLKKAGYQSYVVTDPDTGEEEIRVITNLMGKVRIEAQEQSGGSLYVGYAICFLVLVFYTVFFCYVYAKRLLYVIFLTIIAPLVAISYPLDKIGDGKSQAFDLWLKEYIFNLLIQPFHLLLYLVLITSAFELAGTNVIYSLIAIGFMTPAEKFLRKMFGFDKTTTAGFLSGAAGAAVAMTAVQSIGKLKGGNSKKPVASNDKVKFADNAKTGKRGASSGYTIDKLLGEMTNGESSPSPSNGNSAMQDVYQDVYDATLGDRGGNTPTPVTGRNTGGASGSVGVPSQPRGGAVLSGNLRGRATSEQTGGIPSPEMDVPRLRDVVPPRIREAGVKAGTKIKGFGTTALDTFGVPRDKITPESTKKFLQQEAKDAGRRLKGAAKVGGAVLGAGVGAAAGIMSGDAGNTLKNASAGVYAGSAFGTGAGNIAGNLMNGAIEDAEQIQEDYLKSVHGDNYKEYLKEQQDKKFKNNNELREKYAKELKLKNKAEIDAAMDDAIKYRKYDITDDDLIIRTMKTNGGNPQNRASAERITAAKLASTSKNQKDLDTNVKSIADRVGTERAKTVKTLIKGINKDDNLI